MTLAYSRIGWSAIARQSVLNDPALSLRIAHLLLVDSSALPALTLPEPLAMAVVGMREEIDTPARSVGGR